MADEELTSWRLAAETKEWVGPITVIADGVLTDAFEVTVTTSAARPTTWVAPTVVDIGGRPGVLVGTGTDFPLTLGRKHTVWIRLTDAPEVPVQRVGVIRVY